jgi:hypothetical protein
LGCLAALGLRAAETNTTAAPLTTAPRMRPASSPEATRAPRFIPQTEHQPNTPRPTRVATAPATSAPAPTISLPDARAERTERPPHFQQHTRLPAAQLPIGTEEAAQRRGFDRTR